MISKSKKHNPNYLCKVVNIAEFKEHPNADRLKIATVDFMDVITGKDNKEGCYVYFPVESQIHHSILSKLNLYREKELNSDKEITGFFEKNRRVKAIKLRGIQSFGFLLPIESFAASLEWELPKNLNPLKDKYFDTVNNIIIVNKYEKKISTSLKKGKQAIKTNRLINNQVYLHVDTKNLRKEIKNLKPIHDISITYKMHGTSGWCSNVLVKRKLNLVEKFLKWIGIKIQDTEYDLVYGSRTVVKNKQYKTKTDNFYGYDLWGDVVNKYDLKNKVPPGYSLYYEIVGFTKEGGYIQKGYDYKCKDKEAEIFIYRVTFTNSVGQVYNLNTREARDFVTKIGLTFVPVIYTGYLYKHHLFASENNLDCDGSNKENWRTNLVEHFEELYNNADCYMCNNKVPQEGVVLRIENNEHFVAYKLKSKDFLMLETKQLNDEK